MHHESRRFISDPVMTYDLDFWHTGTFLHYLSEIQRSEPEVKVHGRIAVWHCPAVL